MKMKFDTTYKSMINSETFKGMRRFVSPPFLMMLVASFALWYIAKLSYSYTTEIDVKIKFEDQKFYATCVVEGTGTNLVGYKIYSGGALHLSLNDIKYKYVDVEGDSNEYVELDQEVLSKAISVHCSDIKVISVEPTSPIEISNRMRKIMESND